MVDKMSFAAPLLADVAQRWMRALARYREPRHCRSIFEIAVTLVPFAALWALAWTAVHFGYWELSFLLGVPAAGFLVRLFMIQHDCGHGSFLSSGERLGGPVTRCFYADALRRLAPRTRDPSCKRRPS